MSDRNFDNLDEQQTLARDAMRSLPRPVADADYRARLKAQFVVGEVPEGELSGVQTPAAPHGSETPSRGWLPWAILTTAAALIAVLITMNPLPGPQLLAVAGGATVTVDGHEVADDGLDTALQPGSHVVVGGDGPLDILYPGSFALRLGPGTDVILPERPGRWFKRDVIAPMDRGELSVRTGPDLAGGSLTVQTPEGRALIHGTLVSVFRNDDLTCVCLFEGTADILTAETDLGGLPVGKRWVLFSDGSEPQLLDIVPAHLEHMQGLDATLGGIFHTP